MLTEDMATRALQQTMPAEWAQMTPEERHQAVQEKMRHLNNEVDTRLATRPQPPTTGELIPDLQEATSHQRLAEEFTQADLTESIRAQLPYSAVSFWTWWTTQNPDQEPLITAWTHLWPTLVEEWEETYRTEFQVDSLSHWGEWTAFPWEEYVPEMDEEGEVINMEEEIDSLLEAISHHVKKMALPTLKLIIEAELPDLPDPSRGHLTWEEVTRRLSLRSEDLRVPLNLLSQYEQDDLWAEAILHWDLGDQSPESLTFETELPPWMVTWLENHPDNFLHTTLDVKTRQPTDPGWKNVLTQHLAWKQNQP